VAKCFLHGLDRAPCGDHWHLPGVLDREMEFWNPGVAAEHQKSSGTAQGVGACDDKSCMISLYTFVQNWLDARLSEDRGASLVEYALLVALIAVVCIAAISLLGGAASDKFSTVANSISN